jgi:uncharacterized membrane protein YebE (DUF533 family)
MSDENPQVLLALEVWIATAWADGVINEAEEAGMKAVINIAKLNDEERATALGWLTKKVELDDINVSQIPRDERVNIFAAALGVVAMDEVVDATEKAFLERLQIALQIDDATASSIRKRTGV